MNADQWRRQTIEEAHVLSDDDLQKALLWLHWQVEEWLSEIEPQDFNTPFYEYAMGDIEATIEIYTQEAKSRGIER